MGRCLAGVIRPELQVPLRLQLQELKAFQEDVCGLSMTSSTDLLAL